MCKVCIFDKKLRTETWDKWGQFAAFIALVLTFIDCLDSSEKICIFTILICAIIPLHIILYWRANRLKSKLFEINGTKIEIKFGDIFQQEGIKAIAFNEYFDTIVNEKIISSSSLNGQVLNNHPELISKVQKELQESVHLHERFIGISCLRTPANTKRYQLGTIMRVDDFAFIAFSRFNNENRAVLSTAEYFSALATFWGEIRSECHDKPINIPVLGTGITRYSDGSGLEIQQALENMLNIAKTYNTHFQSNYKISIIISPEHESKINLYKLEY